ncbi:hypothetical protein D3C76_1751450 [compost metagenome]
MPTIIAFEEIAGGTKLTITTRFQEVKQLESAEAMGMIEGYKETLTRLENHFI